MKRFTNDIQDIKRGENDVNFLYRNGDLIWRREKNYYLGDSSVLYKFDMDNNVGLTNSGFDNFVRDFYYRDNGGVIVVGHFTTFDGATYSRIVGLNDDGTVDTSFEVGTGLNTFAFAVEELNDGKIVVAGQYNTYNGTSTGQIIRLNTDGSLDNTFISGTANDGVIDIFDVKDDGKIAIGGDFITYNGYTSSQFALLNEDGSVDMDFNIGDGFYSGEGSNLGVRAIKFQPDGKILVGGKFITYNGLTASKIARLNVDGSLDTEFICELDNRPRDIAYTKDDKILVVGEFITCNGVSQSRITKLNYDGSIDETFDIGTGFNGAGLSIDISLDDKFYISGAFSTYNGLTSSGFIILNDDGTVNTSFSDRFTTSAVKKVRISKR